MVCLLFVGTRAARAQVDADAGAPAADASTSDSTAAPVTPDAGAPEAAAVEGGSEGGPAPTASEGADAGAAPPPAAADQSPPAPPAAPGDAGASEPPNALSSVVVTAERREENIQQVPIAVTATSFTQIQNLDIRATSDIPRVTPNMQADTSEGRSRPRWFIRGVGNNDTANNANSPVSVYMDEVYENFVLAQAFPLFDLERVEVLRGPQGTLWGKNTTGGAVSVTSQKPSFEPGGYGELTVGNYAELGFQGGAGGPIVKDRIAARGSFFYESRNGFVTNAYNGQTQGDLHDVAGRVQLLFVPTDNLEATASIHFRHDDGQSTPSYLVGPNGARSAIPGFNGFTEGSDKYVYDATGPGIDIDDQKGGLFNAKYEAGPVTITSISGYENASRLTQGGSGSDPLPIAEAQSLGHAKQFTEEVRVAPTKADRFNWVFGGHYFWESLYSNSVAATLPFIPAVTGYGSFYGDTQFEEHTQTFAGFLHAAYDFVDWFRLAAGFRWTNDTKSIHLIDVNSGARGAAVFNNPAAWWLPASVSSPLGVAATQDTTQSWNAPTFDVSPTVNIGKDLTTFFRFARGFRSGTFNGSVTAQSNVSVVNPEYVNDYELGAKGNFFQHRLAVSVAGFHYDYQNIQVLVNAQTGAGATTTATILQNAGTATINGAEIEVDALPIPALRLRGNLGLLDAWYGGFTAVNNGAVVNASGNQLVRAPHETAMIDGEYRIWLPASNSLGLGTDWEYRGHQYFNAVVQNNINLEEDGYVLGNARITYYTWDDHLSVQAWVHNLANLEYKILGTQGSPGYNSIYFGPPRTYGATLTGRF